MSYDAESQLIRQTFLAAWRAFADSPPVAHENAPFKPPSNAWVRLSIINAEAFQADMAAAPRYRHPGVVIVQVFVPHGTGDGRARRLADQAAGVFRSRTIGNIVFRAASVLPQGSDGTWYQVNATAEFFRDSTF